MTAGSRDPRHALERFQGELIYPNGQGKYWWAGNPDTAFETIGAIRDDIAAHRVRREQDETSPTAAKAS